jgi:WD40 repeat protein
VKRYPNRERDYTFGLLIQTLRTTIGLSQARLAEHLGVSRRAVAEWEGAAGTRRWIGRELPLFLRRLTFSPDGARLVGGGDDGSVYVWDASDGALLHRMQGHQGAVNGVAFSPDGRRLASCGNDGTIKLWDLQSGKPMQMLRRDRPYERLDITGVRGLTEAQQASLRALGAFEETRVGR